MAVGLPTAGFWALYKPTAADVRLTLHPQGALPLFGKINAAKVLSAHSWIRFPQTSWHKIV